MAAPPPDPDRQGGRPVLRVLIFDADDLLDCVLSMAEGGRKLDTGLTERVHARTGGAVHLEMIRRPAESTGSRLIDLSHGLGANAADVILLSIRPEVLSAAEGSDVRGTYKSAMLELVPLLKAARAHVVVMNGSSVDPSDWVSCYQDVSRPPALVVQELNLALMEVSVLEGISIIDVDRICAELGADAHVEALLSYSPVACAAICDELLRILDDYGFFEARPLVPQVGQRRRDAVPR